MTAGRVPVELEVTAVPMTAISVHLPVPALRAVASLAEPTGNANASHKLNAQRPALKRYHDANSVRTCVDSSCSTASCTCTGAATAKDCRVPVH